MKKEDCTTRERKDVRINIKVTESMSKFIKKNKLSPTIVFLEALKELGYRQSKSL